MTHKELMKRAIELATENVSRGGGPFGAVIARNGNIIAEGVNRVTANHDPTAHAEVQAIRAAASFIYKELELQKEERRLPSEHLLHDEALGAFKAWCDNDKKTAY